MEYGLSALLAKHDPEGRIFQMDPYSLFKLLKSTDDSGQLHYKARRVQLEMYSGAISNVLINDNHWVVLYINALEKKVYFLDSLGNSDSERQIGDRCLKLLRQVLKSIYFVLKYLKISIFALSIEC